MTSVVTSIGSKFNITNLNTMPAMWPLRELSYSSGRGNEDKSNTAPLKEP